MNARFNNRTIGSPNGYLSYIMDRRIKAERAWLISYIESQEIWGFELSHGAGLSIYQI